MQARRHRCTRNLDAVASYRWTRPSAKTWGLVDEVTEQVVRLIAERGPHLGQAAAVFTVTGGDLPSDHATVEDARRAAQQEVGLI